MLDWLYLTKFEGRWLCILWDRQEKKSLDAWQIMHVEMLKKIKGFSELCKWAHKICDLDGTKTINGDEDSQ